TPEAPSEGARAKGNLVLRASAPRNLVRLPAPSSSATASATTRTTRESARTAATRSRSDRARDLARERRQIARHVRGGERREVVADVPARRRLLQIEALEGLRPLIDAAEDDRVRQVLGEDVLALGELLPVRLRHLHVPLEAERAAVQLRTGLRLAGHDRRHDDHRDRRD